MMTNEIGYVRSSQPNTYNTLDWVLRAIINISTNNKASKYIQIQSSTNLSNPLI